MKKTEIFEYWAFGYNYYLLRYRSLGLPVHGSTDSLIAQLDEFFTYVENLNLQVTKRAASDLQVIYRRAKEMAKDAEVDRELASDVTTAINKADATLEAELKLRDAFIVTPKRFDLEYLLEEPSELFAAGVFSLLPPICRFDLASACKAIAYALPTAAAFHLMRGTEGALCFYYRTIVKRGRVAPLMWGNMIAHLRGRRDAPSKAILDHLDNIRANFRNPTQHPDARYDIDEAQDLLAVSIDAINRMVKNLKQRHLIEETKVPF